MYDFKAMKPYIDIAEKTNTDAMKLINTMLVPHLLLCEDKISQ